MVATPVAGSRKASRTEKSISSGPVRALATSMAALKVQSTLVAALASQTPSLGSRSPQSPFQLTTIGGLVVVAAWAGGATKPATDGGATSPAATSAVARATLALRAAFLLSLSALEVAAWYMSCLLLSGTAPKGARPSTVSAQHVRGHRRRRHPSDDS